MAKIAIDVGHARGTGATGNGLEEHEVSRKIADLLKPMLEQQGHEVKIIDYPAMDNRDDLNATIKAANNGGYQLGISLHCDCSSNAKAKGGHVCYYSEKGKRVAEAIAEPLCSLLPGRAQKVVYRDNLAVLKQTKPVWILPECGFISNVEDAQTMKKYPEQIASAIAVGIRKSII